MKRMLVHQSKYGFQIHRAVKNAFIIDIVFGLKKRKGKDEIYELINRQLGAPGQASAKNNVESSTLQSPAQGRQNVTNI